MKHIKTADFFSSFDFDVIGLSVNQLGVRSSLHSSWNNFQQSVCEHTCMSDQSAFKEALRMILKPFNPRVFLFQGYTYAKIGSHQGQLYS